MKKTPSSFINLGFSTIIMVFLTICFVTFASLSVLTAHSDYKLSQKVAEKTTAYYRADALARNVAEHIDYTLYELYESTLSASEYYETIFSTDFTVNMPITTTTISVTNINDITCISYTIPVSDTQNLHVTLKVNYPASDSECFSTITKWQTTTAHTLDTSDTYLNLYTGDES